MKKIILYFLLFLISLPVLADQNTLMEYIRKPEPITTPYVLVKSQLYPFMGFADVYTLNSVEWPTAEMSPGHERLWQNRLVLYRPLRLTHHQALLLVTGGSLYPDTLKDYSFSNEDQFYMYLAYETNSLVAVLKNLPNQPAIFDDGVERKEDSIIAYSWKRYLENPTDNQYWPTHLPMAKTIIKAMDAIQKIIPDPATLTEVYMLGTQSSINEFVVGGSSKRGWATWLASLADDRITAIMPMVIDIFNMYDNIKHVYNTFQKWPESWQDYVAEGVTDQIDTYPFAKLIQIQDILAYLPYEKYKKRLSIPKYIISAGNDQFFPPDSLSYYINQLPGNNKIRVVPNQPHGIDNKLVAPSLKAFYSSILDHTTLPDLTWQQDHHTLTIKTNKKPISVKLWQAENPNAQDFRYETGIKYTSQDIPGISQVNQWEYPAIIVPPNAGFKAYFLEATYENNLVLTTPAYVIGVNG